MAVVVDASAVAAMVFGEAEGDDVRRQLKGHELHAPSLIDRIDFISVHIYPKSDQPEEAHTALSVCDVGKPVVIEETFPLHCSVPDLEAFLRESRTTATGWMWHYDGITLDEYARIAKAGDLTIAQSIWRAALQSFVRLAPEFEQSPTPTP